MRRISSILLAIFILALSTTGCDTDRLQNFATFAGLGMTYVTAFHGLTKAAGDAYIADQNATVIEARTISGDPVAAAPQLLPRLQQNTQKTRDYLISLQTLDEQADLLGSYFAAIAQLTDTKNARAVSDSTEALVDALKGIAPQVESVSIGSKPLVSFAPDVSALAVAHFEVQALDKRLQMDAPVIDRALALQEAAVTAISLQLSLALKSTNQIFIETHIERPYTSAGNLPASWAADREKLIRTTAIVDGGADAKAASAKLRKSFEELVSNKDAQLDLKGLLEALQRMLGYIAAVNGATASAK